MNILLTMKKGENRDIYFPGSVLDALRKYGNIRFNNLYENLTEVEMAEIIKDIDVCVTHWGCPTFTEEVVKNAGRLKLIAHAAGSVAYMVTDYVYEKGIRVCSSNSIMAKCVAESTLAYILAGLRLIPQYSNEIKNGIKWADIVLESKTLFGRKLGLVGLGTVGRIFLNLVKPFDVKIKLYDPYISKASLEQHPNVELCCMEEVLSWGDIISVHASLTPDTHHMLGENQLKLIKDNALFVNTARGAIIDETALVKELESGRFSAVLDVYEHEPLSQESPLRNMKNVIAMPHVAGTGVTVEMSYAMIDEIGRFINNESLLYEIPYEKYKLMTRE